MPDNSVGVYSLPPSYKVSNGDTTDENQHNPPFEDLAQAMSNRLHRDGRTSWTGNQNANGNKITGLAAGTASTDAATVGQGVPIGAMMDFPGATAPSGWLLCAGQAISRSTYSALFAVIGTTYGAGDGSTTFNVPDLRGRVAAGKDDMGGSAANRLTTAGGGVDGVALGASGGAQNVTLTQAQIPAHTHSAGTLATSSAGAHSHTLPGAGSNSSTGAVAGSVPQTPLISTSTDGAHTHTITGSTGSIGSGNAHPNVQPTLVLNKIIKATH